MTRGGTKHPRRCRGQAGLVERTGTWGGVWLGQAPLRPEDGLRVGVVVAASDDLLGQQLTEQGAGAETAVASFLPMLGRRLGRCPGRGRVPVRAAQASPVDPPPQDHRRGGGLGPAVDPPTVVDGAVLTRCVSSAAPPHVRPGTGARVAGDATTSHATGASSLGQLGVGRHRAPAPAARAEHPADLSRVALRNTRGRDELFAHVMAGAGRCAIDGMVQWSGIGTRCLSPDASRCRDEPPPRERYGHTLAYWLAPAPAARPSTSLAGQRLRVLT